MTLICRISTGKIDLKAVRTSFTKIVLLSMFQTVFQYAFLYIALSELSGSVSSVLNQLGSFLLALLLPLADRNERMSAGKIAGCLLGFSGLVLINLNGFHLEFSPGTAAIIISSCSAAIGYILSHRLSESLDPVTSTGCQQLLGGVILTLSGLLSGGQRQALTLLMATLKKPRLLLLDEHTAALDPKTAAKVLETTDKIVNSEHLTTLMITHNMRDSIAHGNRLIMMNAGHVIYDVAGEEKKHLTVQDLLAKFEEAAGGALANDRMILS